MKWLDFRQDPPRVKGQWIIFLKCKFHLGYAITEEYLDGFWSTIIGPNVLLDVTAIWLDFGPDLARVKGQRSTSTISTLPRLTKCSLMQIYVYTECLKKNLHFLKKILKKNYIIFSTNIHMYEWLRVSAIIWHQKRWKWVTSMLERTLAIDVKDVEIRFAQDWDPYYWDPPVYKL